MSVKVDYSIIFWCLFVKNQLGLAFQFWLFQHKYNFGFATNILHAQSGFDWKCNPLHSAPKGGTKVVFQE
jgi:hypothetical protein